MAWKMDANYGKMVNNLLNKEKPPMDENGNYIINAGTRSEKRIPKAEFEAQQKNAPTQADMDALTKMFQTDMDALTKMLSEREANRLKAAQEGGQNPEPYNPRAEWLKESMANSMNRKTPLTAEDFLKQMSGIASTGITAEQLQQEMNKNPKVEWTSANTQTAPNDLMGFTSEQLREKIGNTPSLLNRGLNVNAPAPDVSGPTGTAKVGAPPSASTANNAPAPDVSGPTGTAKVGAPPSASTANNDFSGIINQNGKLMIYSPKTGAWLAEDEVNAQQAPKLYAQLQAYKQGGKPSATGQTPTGTTGGTTQGNHIFTSSSIDPAKDPNNLPYNNPESNRPILPTSYTGQISLPTDPTEMDLMAYLKKQFEDKTWENKYAELQKQYQELADRPDKYSGMIEKAGGEDVAGYIRSLYEGAADPLRREAQRMQEQNAADLAARGLGMSTVVSDVNNLVQRELLANLADLSNRANVQGRDMYLNALRSAADVYGQAGAQKGNILNAMQTNIGNQMGAQQIGLANINDILAKQEARRLTNMQTAINQWDKDVANYWKYQYYPIDAYSGQNSTAATAANVGGQIYNQANTNATAQNQLIGNTAATIAQNIFKQPQNTSWQALTPTQQTAAQTGLTSAQKAFKNIPSFGQIG